MKETNDNTSTTTEATQNPTLQGGHGASGGTKEQAKDALNKATQGVAEAYNKTADKVSGAYEQIAPAAQQAYDKTAHAANETYLQTKQYSHENPGKSLLIALGIGIGIGFIWGQSTTHHSRGGRYARPIVNAVSDVAMEFFR